MSLKIAILGTRGVPNHYGGFEHFAACLSKGLVEKGHHVTVYNSSKHPYRRKEWQGVRIIHCFDPEHIIGVPGQFVYDLNCILDARNRNYDIILMLGYTSSSVWKFLYPKKPVIITNMDGLEWKRTKYSKPVRRFLQYAEKLAIYSGHYHIADSPVIKAYLDSHYNINSKYIAYGAELHPLTDESMLAAYTLVKRQYFLLMARMEPENNIEMILDGFCATLDKLKFAVIGNTANGYGKYIVEKYKNEPRIVFLGAIFEDTIVQSITACCKLYFHGHSVGGTNPSLLDAMGAKVPVAAHDNPFNKSILRNNAQFFSDAADVTRMITANAYNNPTHIENNYTCIENDFSWHTIIDQYETYFLECFKANRAYYPLKHEKSILYKG